MRAGHAELYAGAIMAIRNPRTHRIAPERSPNEVVELLVFASLLRRWLDLATVAP